MKPDCERAIRAKEVDYELRRTIARKSAVSHGDLKKFEKLSGKDVLPMGTHEKIGQQIFQYTPLAAKFDEQKKAIEVQGEKMVKAIEGKEKEGHEDLWLAIPDEGKRTNLRQGPNIDSVGKDFLRPYILEYAKEVENQIKNNPFFRIEVDKKTAKDNIINQKVNLEDFAQSLFNAPETSDNTYWNMYNYLDKRGKSVARSTNMRKEDHEKEAEDFGNTNTKLKDAIHGIYNSFRKAAPRLGMEVQSGSMRTRAESVKVSEDVKRIVNDLIKDDPSLSRVGRKRIEQKVQNLLNSG